MIKSSLLVFSFMFITAFSNGQTTLFSENFDGTPLSVISYSSGTGSAWGICSIFSKSGSNSDSAKVSTGDSLFLQTDTFNTLSYTFLRLEFNQICKVDFFDKGIIEYSTDSGSTWSQLSSSDYLGVGTMFQNGFSSISYSEWQVSNSNATPDSTWWKSETFNLDAAAGFDYVLVRYVLIDADNNGAVNNYGWMLDDIKITGSSCELNPPSIQLQGTIYQGTIYQTGPFTIESKITDTSDIYEAFIVYQKNNGTSDTATMSRTSGAVFKGAIPSVSIGDTICYLVYAVDSSACRNLGVLQVSNCIQFVVKSNPPPTCIGTTINSYDYFEDLSGFTAGNGIARVGLLKSNWENSTDDSHDWYVYNFASRSADTGPSADHSLNDDNYLYIEATGNFNDTANLLTPCFDLNGLNQPSFDFWYHMYGADMGELHLDVYFGGKWVLDIMPTISGDQGDNWKKAKVDLTSYIGNTIKLRFRGITGNGFRSDIAIDDIEINDLPLVDVGVRELLLPSTDACSGSSNESLSVRLYNYGFNAVDTIPLAYQINGGTTVIDTAFVNIPSLDSAEFTFSQTFNMSASGNYSINTWTLVSNDGRNSNDSLLNQVVASSAITSTFPDTSNFDNFTPGIPGVFNDEWSNASNDGHDWYVSTGPTPSNNTGPASDTTSGTGNFLFMEATSINQGVEAKLLSKCYDFSGLNKAELTFYYHMLGFTMGELHLDILEDGVLTQDIITPISGNQGNSWKSAVVDLSAYSGTVKLVFRATCGSGFQSDIAIDDVSIRDAQPVGLGKKTQYVQTILIFPNPVSDELTIDLSAPMPAQMQLVNLTGKLVLERQFTMRSNRLDFSDLPSGVYFIRIQTAEELFTKKIIKN